MDDFLFPPPPPNPNDGRKPSGRSEPTHRVGFTGTQDGTTRDQMNCLYNFFEQLDKFEFHQGCCIGADEQATVAASHYADVTIYGYPSNIRLKTAPRCLRLSHVLAACKPPLERNRDIVGAVELLLACPKGMKEEQRSGTWATIRYARKLALPIVVFWPDGTVTEEKQRD
jgi:hypothetical protein